jgi:predicted HicB family RNase H-like nuclease
MRTSAKSETEVGNLNLRSIPHSVIRRAKAAAALEGKTLRIWVIEAIQEKIRKAK